MHGWCSSRLRVEPIFWSGLLTRSGFALYRRNLAIFDSVAPNAFGVDESQQTLNCALSVDLL